MAGRGREREERVESWERKDGKVKGARNRYICRFVCCTYVSTYICRFRVHSHSLLQLPSVIVRMYVSGMTWTS